MPLERGEKYEEPLNDYLTSEGLGEVTGGGTMMSARGEIEYVGVDVDVYDANRAIPLITQKLKDLGVPEGTVIEQYEPVKREFPIR